MIDNFKETKDKKEWDFYWSKKKSKVIYDFIAFFYRILLIRPSLNYHIKKFYKNNSYLLHAGCGGGQVDKSISKNMNICAIDISDKALELYKKNNISNKEVIHGSIFKTNFQDKKFDGIYNLGVMEHFEIKNINKILKEFNRILKDEGKIIMFWPHKNGISVNFLKFLKYIFKILFKFDLKLHPDEITYVTSKEQIESILENNNLSLDYYYFGIMDMYTQSVIVAKKNLNNNDYK